MAIHVVLIRIIKESRVRVNKHIHKEINDKKWTLTDSYWLLAAEDCRQKSERCLQKRRSESSAPFWSVRLFSIDIL